MPKPYCWFFIWFFILLPLPCFPTCVQLSPSSSPTPSRTCRPRSPCRLLLWPCGNVQSCWDPRMWVHMHHTLHSCVGRGQRLNIHTEHIRYASSFCFSTQPYWKEVTLLISILHNSMTHMIEHNLFYRFLVEGEFIPSVYSQEWCCNEHHISQITL